MNAQNEMPLDAPITVEPPKVVAKATQKETKNKDEIEMIVIDGVLKVQDLPEVYKQFKKAIPEEGLQESKAAETRKGYDTLGYGYAWITERLNDVVPFCWRVLYTKEVLKEGKTKNGNIMSEITYEVVLQLGNWKTKEIINEKSDYTHYDDRSLPTEVVKSKTFEIQRAFEVLAETPVMDGWHRAFSIADAKKGAKTNGLKKVAAFFGIGNAAYKKSIDEENQEVKEALTKKRAKKGSSPAAAATPASNDVQMIKTKLDALGAKTDADKIAFLKNKCNFSATNINTLSSKQVGMVLFKLMEYSKTLQK